MSTTGGQSTEPGSLDPVRAGSNEVFPMRGWWNKGLGNRGERAAARYLKRQGFRILHRQYTTPLGEIDLVAREGGTIVFVEVKTRKSSAAGHPVEAVTLSKRKKLTQLALAFLKRYNLLEYPARFDVMTVLWPDDSRKPTITHYRNAFEPDGSGQMFS